MTSEKRLFEITLNFCKSWKDLSQFLMSDLSDHNFEWFSMFRKAIFKWQTCKISKKKIKFSFEIYKLIKTRLCLNILIKQKFLRNRSRCKKATVEMYQEACDELKNTFFHIYKKKEHKQHEQIDFSFLTCFTKTSIVWNELKIIVAKNDFSETWCR